MSPFVPKPHTPFQWERQLTMEEVRARVDYLRECFRPHKRLKLKWHMPEMSWLEGVFSRGDRRLAPVVRRAYEKGALFTSWKDHLRLEPWREALAEEGLDPESFLAERDVDVPLPWDHLTSGVAKRFLLTERGRALAEKLTDDCRYNACRNCGVCNFEGRESELAAQARAVEIRPRVAHASRDQADAVGGPGHQTTAHGEAPEVPEAPPIPEAPAPRRPGGPKAKPPDIGELSDKACHYRIWHTKTGELRFISQIELQTLIERIMRRGRVPVSFSAGFHPLPRVSFGRALPVGVASEREWFNLFLRKDMGPRELADSLLPHLPMGFELLSIETLSMGKKQPQPLAEDFRLEYLLPEDAARERLAQWEAALALESIDLERVNKKGKASVWNLRPFIVRAEPGVGRALALRLDWSERYISPLKIIEAVNPGLAPTSSC